MTTHPTPTRNAPSSPEAIARAIIVAQAERGAALAKHAAFVRAKNAAEKAGDIALAEFATHAAEQAAAHVVETDRATTRLIAQRNAARARQLVEHGS